MQVSPVEVVANPVTMFVPVVKQVSPGVAVVGTGGLLVSLPKAHPYDGPVYPDCVLGTSVSVTKFSMILLPMYPDKQQGRNPRAAASSLGLRTGQALLDRYSELLGIESTCPCRYRTMDAKVVLQLWGVDPARREHSPPAPLRETLCSHSEIQDNPHLQPG